jgi:hypothetical protein
MAIQRNVDLTIDPSDREAGTLWGEAAVAHLLPTPLGHRPALPATFRLTCGRVDGLERGKVADLRCRGCR